MKLHVKLDVVGESMDNTSVHICDCRSKEQ
jgi:hypothetical protein